jgi:hypothetical protein
MIFAIVYVVPLTLAIIVQRQSNPHIWHCL